MRSSRQRFGTRCPARLVGLFIVGLCLLHAHRATADDAPLIWSLAPVDQVEPPEVADASWPAGAIDRFVLARLEAEQMQPAPPLTKAQLIRRVYFDLWGLPPSPDEVRAFVADPADEAYERLVERLLSDRRYGERWARYWLDLVRFAETNGYERDAPKPNAWKYRDWVIESLVDNKSYDRFVTEQLAGDELPDASDETRVATGMLRVGTFDDEPNDPLQYKYEQWDDLIHVTSTAFLSLTIKCARCHDHKFDPIPQTDYYAFLNFFTPGHAAEGELLAWTDASSQAPPVHLLENGDPRREAQVVGPSFPSLLPELAREVTPPAPDAPTTGRRLQLAQWIVDPANPLTARVMVNRLWQHHMGQGLVRTPDNFGVMGHEPTHPALLDWLAAELVNSGWSLNHVHRLILHSNTYRQSSSHPLHDEYAQRDFANELWWRANRRRLEAESLRDSLLAVSGELNLEAGGPSFFPPISPEALEGLSKKGAAWGESPPDQQRRRSIYMFTKRSLLVPLMTVFDMGDTTLPCAKRAVTTVAPQALALLNNDFVHEQSTQFAERVATDAGSDVSAQIDRAWWLALSRAPTAAEREAALAHLQRQQQRFADQQPAAVGSGPDQDEAREFALASLCHVLLNLNEFIYID